MWVVKSGAARQASFSDESKRQAIQYLLRTIRSISMAKLLSWAKTMTITMIMVDLSALQDA